MTVLSDRQEKAVKALAEWVAKNGNYNVSHRLIHGTDYKINNDVNYAFKNSKLPGKSALATAMHYAGIEYNPGMKRDSSIEDDIAELIGLYNKGLQLSETSMTKDPKLSKLYYRLRKRVGGWLNVVDMVCAKIENVDRSRFVNVGTFVEAGHPDKYGVVNRLRSRTEWKFDTIFNKLVPNYVQLHEHDVRLNILIPGISYDNSPYSGVLSPSVDILVASELVIEISYFTGLRTKYKDDGYTQRVNWKLAKLREEGFKAVRLEAGTPREHIAVDIVEAFAAINIELNRETVLTELHGYDVGRDVAPVLERGTYAY